MGSAAHHVDIRVYYEDTDAGGVVYYANYLKFAERARTEWLREKGFSQEKLKSADNILFAVRHVDADIQKPARLDDLLQVATEITKTSGVRFYMTQKITRHDELLVVIKVQIACINADFKPVRLPDGIIS